MGFYLIYQESIFGQCIYNIGEGIQLFFSLLLLYILSSRGLGIMAKKCLYEGVIVPAALYGAEAWGMRSAERRK